MSVAILEMQRARRAVEAFCEKRNLGMHSSMQCLRCQQDGEDLLLMETRVPGAPPGAKAGKPLVRLHYSNGGWFLFCPDQRGGWAPYPHLPRADNIAVVLEELERAPLHVHW